MLRSLPACRTIEHVTSQGYLGEGGLGIPGVSMGMSHLDRGVCGVEILAGGLESEKYRRNKHLSPQKDLALSSSQQAKLVLSGPHAETPLGCGTADITAEAATGSEFSKVSFIYTWTAQLYRGECILYVRIQSAAPGPGPHR